MPPANWNWLPISGYTGHCPGLKYDVGHSFDWVVRHLREINSGPSYNHVVVTPHGHSVGDAGSGQGGPADVADSSAPGGHLTPTHYPAMPRGSIAGYTGFIPGQHQQVGLNYHSASDAYFTDLERQASTRNQDRAASRVRSAGAGAQGINVRTAEGPAATPTPTPPAAQPTADPAGIDNKYSRYSSTHKSATKEAIPIAGYGGFVPLARTTQIGVGKPFQQFANEGFSRMHEVKDLYKSPQQPSTVVA
ncbi:uncharacterized protein LOC122373647 isoform X1 [Amphibalanus amphitrite]|uniref:uncharacterized protein LOC122373647 isoform X1 n=1 Tax=Amphibalanus amphitrite TaxID=1232801 RepID=UPI001C8FB75A|nr:uncharacterized protein LOC122373647 isoform X1 [Amphibalanus amphitrite]